MARRVEPDEVENLVDIAAPEKLPILIVDDRLENLQALEAVLAPLGLPIVRAGSGGEALRMLLEQDFALILLDVRMPGLDGIETAHLIKGRSRTRDVPIVFMTAARDEVSEILRGYGAGAVDYVLKPFEADLLRSKVAVFVELEERRRALERSEALLRGAFEAAPIGKTVLDAERRIVRANPAFGRLLRVDPSELQGADVLDWCSPGDADTLASALEEPGAEQQLDLRLRTGSDAELWVSAAVSAIETAEDAEPLQLIQWVDLSSRRRAEEARAELLLEQAARTHAEALAERLNKLQALAGALESPALPQLLSELATRLSELFTAELVEISVEQDDDDPIAVRAARGHLVEPGALAHSANAIEAPLELDRVPLGRIRLTPGERGLEPADRSLLLEAAARAALAIRRAQLHGEEHRIAVELQKGLLPKDLPEVEGVELAVHYEAAGLAAQVGGDWYDAFALGAARVGIVVGDVAGRGIRAASAMGQLRSLARGFALADEQSRLPGEALTRLNAHQRAVDSEDVFTILYAIVDRAAGTVTWANAGHPPPLLREPDGTVSYLEGGDGLIGIAEVEYRAFERRIEPGSTLVLYTDGLIERRGESLDAGMERLAAAVLAGPQPSHDLFAHILASALTPDTQLEDDITAVVVSLHRS